MAGDASFLASELGDLLRSLRLGPEAGLDAELDRERRRQRGVYFTPRALVDFVARRLLDAYGEISRSAAGRPQLRVLDPAAGDGRFLDAVADLLAARGFAKSEALRCCVGLERDPALAEIARARLPGADIRCCEALLGSPDIGRFDVIVGNPPYVRSIRLGESDEALRKNLRGRYQATSHGEWDLYAAFIEQCHDWLSVDGHCGLVVPSRWLTARSARELRAELAVRGAVRGLVDFGSEQIFDGATTYLSTVFLAASPSVAVNVARLRGDSFDIGSVATTELGRAPWRMSVGRGKRILEAMTLAGPPLGDMARIIKGTGTNADRVFLLESDADVESALVRPCVRGRDVTANGAVDTSVRALVPYRDSGELIDPVELRAKFPRAAAHLDAHRERLEERERGRFCGERFYQFGRPQNLAALLAKQPKIIVPDVAREGRAMVDVDGALVLDSAYAVIPHSAADIPRILAVLNSPAVGLWLRETGIPLRGGYVRMKTAYLQSLPVAQCSAALRVEYGVDRKDWNPAVPDD